MAEFKLDRFKYIWRGDWVSGTVYNRDDIVRVGGKSYVCLIGHTADAVFRTDLNAILPDSNPPQPQPRWRVMTSSRTFRGTWLGSTVYDLDDIVFYDGSLWVCSTGHTSGNFYEDVDNWTSFGDHIEFKGEWSDEASYGQGALVKYNGIVYRCEIPHAAQTTIEDDIDKWSVFHEGIEYRGAWLPITQYRKNDLVKYGGTVFRCNSTHVSGAAALDDTKFDVEFPGYQFEGDWQSDVIYNEGDVVIFSGNSYYAVANNQGVEPDDNENFWILLAYSYNYRGDYDIQENYRPGDIIQRGGDLYISLSEVDAGDGSTNDFLDPTTWELLKPGVRWNNFWRTDTQYYPGDIVYFKGSAFKCVEQHVSAINNFPGDNGSGFDYWEMFLQAGIQAGLEQRGDLLTYGLTRDEVGDGSTFGLTNVPIGNEGQFLSATEDAELFYRNWVYDSDVVYVGMHGEDKDGYGLDANRPFKTIQHAADFVLFNYEPLTPVKIKVNTGRYQEALPITVPAGTVVMGDELRSTVVEAASADPDYDGDWTFTTEYLSHLREVMTAVIQNIPVDPQAGNTIPQDVSLEPATNSAVPFITAPIDAVKTYLNFRILNGLSDAVLTGNNIKSELSYIVNAHAIIQANINFLAEECVKFRAVTDTNIDEERVRRDAKTWIRSIAYDLEYLSNWKSIRAAQVYYSRVVGSTQDADMFYLRDTTGLRNMTLEGLNGRLNPPGVFEIFQRPTGGAYSSLDPGWGPADNKVWINNRSPYIQGVTTIGTNCIGQKIDGALHNGGNKSFTSNDFTQVLSDGIGAWVLNNGRAELVSVFTYYNQIGYLAENGGVIRATNGNNSYGKYGAVSSGIDPSETPATAEVWNRNNEAIVSSAFAGEFQDAIFAFEYSHAGEEYTQATADIIGSGGSANIIYDEFRNGAIFQSRLLNYGSGNSGGSGYTVAGNNAQEGDGTSLRLAQSDDAGPLTYLGMRIVITAGDGTGQYGIVDTFNDTTKVVTVIRESDGQPGWDHIVPGTEIAASIGNNAVYRIEPRITVSHPGFTELNYDLPTARTYRDMAHGDTTAVFTEIEGQLGSGSTDDTVAPTVAVFNITRTGSEYSIEIVTGGAGYQVGDQIIVEGNNLGGSAPENNATIIVTATTDDSTNAITGATISGTGLSGKFVAISEPNFVSYSTNGQTWNETFLTEIVDWDKVVSGNGRFIIMSGNSDKVAVSLDGEEWTINTLPINEAFSDIKFGNGKFIIIAENTNTVLESTDGETWIQRSIPDDTLGDSAASQWQAVAYGARRWLAVAGGDRGLAYSDNNGVTWTRVDNGLPDDTYDFISLTYGFNRFVAVTRDGKTLVSLDRGATWIQGEMPTQDGSTPMNWIDVKYANGLWFAICDTGGVDIGGDPTDGPTTYCTTSEDAIMWDDRNLLNEERYGALTHATVNKIPTWFVLANERTNDAVAAVRTGRRAKLRAAVTGSQISEMKIWDPGSGYVTDINEPTLEITDNTFTSAVLYDLRLGHGVLPQPSFINRGIGYRTSSTRVTIEGDGFADIIPESTFVTLRGVAVIPGPGAQLRFASIPNLETEDPLDRKIYTATQAVDLGDDGTNAGTRLVRFTILPSLEIEDALGTGTAVEIRERYSQCRITGHDFLDIGTGNFEETNYPDIYAGGNFFTASPENEVLELNGGRVFYASTDQDGNFRAGELFAVEQATGIVTISAEFFELDGLSELALGGVRLGGSGTVIREFSTDITFTEDSNNVIPTQAAIATFFNNRLSQGGSEIATNNLQAGNVLVGSEENRIDTVAGELIFPKRMNFDSSQTTVNGSILGQLYFLASFNE